MIVVVGRESNCDASFSPTVGHYDFDHCRDKPERTTCAFWDQSYGAIARVSGIGLHDLKDVSRRAATSPVAFADVMPQPVAFRTACTSTARRVATDESIDRQLNTLMDCFEAAGDVKLVILTGHKSGARGNAESERNLGFPYPDCRKCR